MKPAPALHDVRLSMTQLVHHDRLEEAVVRATKSASITAKLHVIRLVVGHVPREMPRVVALLSPEVAEELDPEAVGRVVAAVARHTPEHLADVLRRLSPSEALVGPLFEAAIGTDSAVHALDVLLRVLDMPAPLLPTERAVYLDAFDKASGLAVRLGDVTLALQIADRSRAFADESPRLHEAAARTYAAGGDPERAIDHARRARDLEGRPTERAIPIRRAV